MIREENENRPRHEEDEHGPRFKREEFEFRRESPVSRFILRNFFGATITVRLVDGQTVTGEVVDGFDGVIGIKSATGVITFINEFFITTFI